MPGRRADVPTYRELLAREDGPPGSSWGVFGPDDQLGTLNFITADVTARAAGLVPAGRVFNLDYPLNTFVPSIAGTRPAAVHHMFANNPNHRRRLAGLVLPAVHHADRRPAAHAAPAVRLLRRGEGRGRRGRPPRARHPAGGARGVSPAGVSSSTCPATSLRAGRGYDITTNQMIWPADLDAALAFQRVTLESGDILLLRTGWSGYYLELGAAGQEPVPARRHARARPGPVTGDGRVPVGPPGRHGGERQRRASRRTR